MQLARVPRGRPFCGSSVAALHLRNLWVGGSRGCIGARVAPASTEPWSLNVVPRHHGHGVALELMTSVLGGTGVPAYLWVVRDNARAVAFYRKHGFELDGGTRYDPDWDRHEVRMTTT
ncbi:GNAT family N-acetyltransferase [Gordonia sp. HS-NH1]|uniref:GNAT family N-acetyltransferase n=1 Tax=Gordonia sp. HS-NH1 TaxID=1435068 RepID=UPI002F3F6C7C